MSFSRITQENMLTAIPRFSRVSLLSNTLIEVISMGNNCKLQTYIHHIDHQTQWLPNYIKWLDISGDVSPILLKNLPSHLEGIGYCQGITKQIAKHLPENINKIALYIDISSDEVHDFKESIKYVYVNCPIVSINTSHTLIKKMHNNFINTKTKDALDTLSLNGIIAFPDDHSIKIYNKAFHPFSAERNLLNLESISININHVYGPINANNAEIVKTLYQKGVHLGNKDLLTMAKEQFYPLIPPTSLRPTSFEFQAEIWRHTANRVRSGDLIFKPITMIPTNTCQKTNTVEHSTMKRKVDIASNEHIAKKPRLENPVSLAPAAFFVSQPSIDSDNQSTQAKQPNNLLASAVRLKK